MLNFSDLVRIVKLLDLKLETKIEKLFLELGELRAKLLDGHISEFCCLHYA